jgi:hypothetical protein
MYTLTYGRDLISLFVNHNVNDDILVLVVTFTGVEEPSNKEDLTSDTEASSSACVQNFGL